MNYSEIAAEGDITVLHDIADKVVNECGVVVIRDPRGGALMVRNIDPLEQTPFNFGEAFVTECDVEVEGVPGYGCILGPEGDRALYAAIIDAVMHSELPVRSTVEAALSREAGALQERRDAESSMVASTRVDFRTV